MFATAAAAAEQGRCIDMPWAGSRHSAAYPSSIPGVHKFERNKMKHFEAFRCKILHFLARRIEAN
jgi:hypothetical protein